ncbi:Uncharacterised protein [Bordetella pertussis]|nr:Uncharacterised protein [Bordetella pertussis]
MPSMDRPITSVKPSAPPVMVQSALRWPCIAPCVRASSVLGPGVSDSPMTAIR